MISIIYLHGLLSSSKSKKAVYFKNALSMWQCYIPDLYSLKWEFEDMTTSYILKKVKEWSTFDGNDKILIGSSFGGLLATRFAQINQNNVKALILIAPALNYFDILTKYSFNEEDISTWKKKSYLEVEHPSWTGKTKWNYSFFSDLKENHHPMNKKLDVPILIFHGTKDDVIPISYVERFIEDQESKNIELIKIENGDHYLYDHLEFMVGKSKSFLKRLDIS